MQTELTKKQLKKIATAKDYNTIAQIAIASIKKARKKHKGINVIELCAPISSGGKGNIPDNLAEMNKAIKVLCQLPKSLLFNQLPYEDKIADLKKYSLKDGQKLAYDMRVLLFFYEPFFEKGIIDMLVFLPGWQSSTGASWEYTKAKRLGIKTRQLHDNWAKLFAKGERDIKKLTFKI